MKAVSSTCFLTPKSPSPVTHHPTPKGSISTKQVGYMKPSSQRPSIHEHLNRSYDAWIENILKNRAGLLLVTLWRKKTRNRVPRWGSWWSRKCGNWWGRRWMEVANTKMRFFRSKEEMRKCKGAGENRGEVLQLMNVETSCDCDIDFCNFILPVGGLY